MTHEASPDIEDAYADDSRRGNLNVSDEEQWDTAVVVAPPSPDVTGLLGAMSRLMDAVEDGRRRLDEVLADQARLRSEREEARVERARLEAQLAAERHRREVAEAALAEAKRDLYGDEARLRAERLQAHFEAERDRRLAAETELERFRAQVEAAAGRRAWWRRK